MSPVVLSPLPAWDWRLWTSTVCETEIGYRIQAYTIFFCFARNFPTRYFFSSYFYVCLMSPPFWGENISPLHPVRSPERASLCRTTIPTLFFVDERNENGRFKVLALSLPSPVYPLAPIVSLSNGKIIPSLHQPSVQPQCGVGVPAPGSPGES
jgi:hypothetical protein